MFDLSQHIAKPGEPIPAWAQEILDLPQMARLIDAWKNAKGQQSLPSPEDLPPEKLVFCMPDITVTEFISPTHVRYRLVGTNVTSRLGIDLTDKNMFDFTPTRYHGLINEIYAMLLTECTSMLTKTSNTLSSGVIRQVNAIHLPMINHGGEANRVLNLHLPSDPKAYHGSRNVTEISSEIEAILMLPFTPLSKDGVL